MREGSPWYSELIEGDPKQVGQRQLIPVVKVWSIVRRRVTFGIQGSNGGGIGLVWMQPIAMIDRRPDGSEERVPIPDATGTAIKGMLIGALALPILYLCIANSTFLWRHRRAKEAVKD